jgi:tRNA-splicing ligase RtcB
MGDNAVILEGIEHEESVPALYSTVHGAGRVMSRTKAAGKRRFRKGRVVQLSQGIISREMMLEWTRRAGVTIRGGGTDESPHCYRRLDGVLAQHRSVRVVETLRPVGVAMAASGEVDPYRD